MRNLSLCCHDWVATSEHYVEQYYGAICKKCGKLGCYCDYIDQYRGKGSKDFLNTLAEGNKYFHYLYPQKSKEIN